MDTETPDDLPSHLNTLRSAVLELLEEVEKVEGCCSVSMGRLLEAVKQQNRHMGYEANELGTLYDSAKNGDLLRHYLLVHSTSSLVTCEEKMRETLIVYLKQKLQALVDVIDTATEVEERAQFSGIIARFLSCYDSFLANGDYMTYPKEWFTQRIEELVEFLNQPGTPLKLRYNRLLLVIKVLEA